MKAFHSKPEIKKEYLNRVEAHRKADEIIKGQYWKEGKGCAVGCTIHSSNHKSYETILGIPEVLARLEDSIFEGLPNDFAQEWLAEFLSAIPVGADLSLVWPKFAIWLLVDEKFGVLKFAETSESKKAIQDIADLYSRVIVGEVVSKAEWINAAADADAAHYTAAHTATSTHYACVAAHYAADAAYYAAAHYAADAARAAGNAAADAAYDAAKTARIAQSEKLLELLRNS